MWKKLFGVSAISLATWIVPGAVTAAAEVIPPGMCEFTGAAQGDFNQQGDWQGQNVTLAPCGS